MPIVKTKLFRKAHNGVFWFSDYYIDKKVIEVYCELWGVKMIVDDYKNAHVQKTVLCIQSSEIKTEMEIIKDLEDLIIIK